MKAKIIKPLTKTDIKVIKLLCIEATSKEIGTIIGLTYKRVEGIRLDLLTKTKSRNVVGIVKYAIKNNIYRLR